MDYHYKNLSKNVSELYDSFAESQEKIKTLENTLIQKLSLLVTKDKLLDDKDAEIEKLKSIISNMEDGEGVVDFVNDFIKKDEKLIEIQTSQLATAEEDLSECIKRSSKLSGDHSLQCRKTLEIEIDKMSIKDIRLANGDGMDPLFLETTFSIKTIVDSINSWRRGRCSHENTSHISVGNCSLFKQNDDGSLYAFRRTDLVKVYMDKDVTLTDVKEDPTLYINAFLNLTSSEGFAYNCDFNNIEKGFGGVFKNRIVVQNDFEPQDGGDDIKFMNLSDIWYVEHNPVVNIHKTYRNSYKTVSLKSSVAEWNNRIQFSWWDDC